VAPELTISLLPYCYYVLSQIKRQGGMALYKLSLILINWFKSCNEERQIRGKYYDLFIRPFSFPEKERKNSQK